MIDELKALRAKAWIGSKRGEQFALHFDDTLYLELVAQCVAQRCIDYIETYRIPVGNSPAGELACEWTYDALHCIRDDIKQEFKL